MTVSLERTRTNMANHSRLFEREVELMHRQTQRAHQREVSMRLAVSPAILTPAASVLTPSASTNSVAENVSFPMTTILDFQNHAFTGRDDILSQIHSL